MPNVFSSFARISTLSFLLLWLFPWYVLAQTGACERSLGEAYLDINNVRARILNNGALFYGDWPYGYEVPRESGISPILSAALWLGARMGNETTPRVAMTYFGPWEFWAGPLDENGNPPANCGDYDRLYKVNRSDIVAYEASGTTTPDLLAWPTGLGAPTLAPGGNSVDDDGDGQIDESGEQVGFDIRVPLEERANRVIDLVSGERPAILGDQSIWWVMNDRGNTHEHSQSQALGVEVHGLAYASQVAGTFGDITYYRFTVYNRGTESLNETYFGFFVDPDLGDFGDDFIGSDSTLGMAYVYNSDNEDLTPAGYGYGTSPPAVGIDFLRGPAVPAIGDSAWIDGQWLPDFTNLAMTSFAYDSDGPCGINGCSPNDYTAFYNMLKGLWWDGTPFRYGGVGVYGFEDTTRSVTRFMFSGDPLTGNGWSELNPDPFVDDEPANGPADRRILMSMGPATMAPNERHEMTIGIFYARGEDHLDSISKLRVRDALVQSAFDAGLDLAPANNPNVTRPRRAVVLEAPAHGVDAQPVDMTLYWHVNPNESTVYYDVQLATDEAFAQLIRQATATINRLDISDLATSTSYNWRVRAVNEAGEGPWSDTWRFTTSAEANPLIIQGFLAVSNAAGPIDPPDMAAFAFDNTGFPILEGSITPEGSYPNALQPTAGIQQSSSEAVWGFHAGGVQSAAFGSTVQSGSFFSRVLRASNITRLAPYDYEMRFTEACSTAINGSIEPSDCLAWRLFDEGALVEVPFELWRIGENTSDDPSDDLRLIPGLCESSCAAGSEDFTFDIGGDHLISEGDDDPMSDWIYWYLPAPEWRQPGQAGYDQFFFGNSEDRVVDFDREIMARVVLVNLNGGMVPPYTAALPETGTTFRIVSGTFSPPTHSAPSHEAHDVVQPVSLYWYSSKIATQELLVATDPDFNQVVNSVTLDAAVTTFTPSSLVAGLSYYWRLRLVDQAGQGLSDWSDTWMFGVNASSVAEEESTSLPTTYALEPNYPNPFNLTTNLRYALPSNAEVHLAVYDLLGRRVLTLVNEHQPAGWHELTFDANGLPSGVYFYVLQADRFTQARSMVLHR